MKTKNGQKIVAALTHYGPVSYFEDTACIYFSSYAFYIVNSLDTHYIIHRPLLAIICIFLAFIGDSMLQHFTDTPIAYCYFQVLSSVTEYSE